MNLPGRYSLTEKLFSYPDRVYFLATMNNVFGKCTYHYVTVLDGLYCPQVH